MNSITKQMHNPKRVTATCIWGEGGDVLIRDIFNNAGGSRAYIEIDVAQARALVVQLADAILECERMEDELTEYERNN